MLVIPDTNALFSDPFLEGPLIRTIVAAEKQAGIRLVIPEVVVDELRNHVEERLSQTVKAAAKVRNAYAGLSGQNPYAIDFNLSPDQRKAVLDRFDQRIQQLYEEGRILKYPSPTPKELSLRSIKGQAPFQDNDRGMRDTLIWLTAKECAIQGPASNSKIILVSEDKAFWDKEKKKLHEGLVGELRDEGIPADSITSSPTLQNVVENFVAGKLPQAEWVKVAVEGDQIADFTASSDVVLLKMTDWIYDNPEVLEVGDYIFVDFDIVEDAVLRSVKRTLDLGHNEVLVNSEWTCEVAAEGYDNPHFANSLRFSLQFELSSIIQVHNDDLSVGSHEVNDVDVLDVTENEPT